MCVIFMFSFFFVRLFVTTIYHSIVRLFFFNGDDLDDRIELLYMACDKYKKNNGLMCGSHHLVRYFCFNKFPLLFETKVQFKLTLNLNSMTLISKPMITA